MLGNVCIQYSTLILSAVPPKTPEEKERDKMIREAEKAAKNAIRPDLQ